MIAIRQHCAYGFGRNPDQIHFMQSKGNGRILFKLEKFFRDLSGKKIQSGKVSKAVLHMTALGIYEAEINGQKVGDALFTPGFSYYPSHLYYLH